MEYNTNLDKLHEDLMDAIESNQNNPPYEVANMMIWLGVKLYCDLASNDTIAFKSIIASVMTGLNEAYPVSE